MGAPKKSYKKKLTMVKTDAIVSVKKQQRRCLVRRIRRSVFGCFFVFPQKTQLRAGGKNDGRVYTSFFK